MSLAYHSTAELQLALQTLVPAMGRGLDIRAGGQALTLLNGRLAERLADELSHGLRLELMRREAAAAQQQERPL